MYICLPKRWRKDTLHKAIAQKKIPYIKHEKAHRMKVKYKVVLGKRNEYFIELKMI